MRIENYTDEELRNELSRRKGICPTAETTSVNEYPAVCTDCSKDTTVPFKPKKGWDVRCMECYKKFKGD